MFETSTPNAPLEVALRIPATRISPTGLAYDHVSGRFLMVDSGSDKLVSVDELSRHMVDLVKADSAGFRDITAFEIDTRRGDLWVVSAGGPGGTDHESVTALHKLQLISGRPLAKFQPGDGFGGTRFEDVAVGKSGDVFVLDAAGGRVFRLAPRTTTLRMACRLRLDHPVSLALAGDRAAIAYVAHAGGLARVDLATGRSTRVAASKSLRLDGLERIRFDSGHIVGTQRGDDGIRHVVSIRIAGGTAPRAVAVERLDSVDAVAGGTLTALSGDDVVLPDARGGARRRRRRVRRPARTSAVNAGLKPCPTARSPLPGLTSLRQGYGGPPKHLRRRKPRPTVPLPTAYCLLPTAFCLLLQSIIDRCPHPGGS